MFQSDFVPSDLKLFLNEKLHLFNASKIKYSNEIEFVQVLKYNENMNKTYF